MDPQLGKKEGTRGGPRWKPNEPIKITQRIHKALGVKKKIANSPFRGSRIHKYSSLARTDPEVGPTILNGAYNPSSSKTGPDEG